jgi:serine protease Do
MWPISRLGEATRRGLLAGGVAACCLAPAAHAQDMTFSQAQLVRGLLPSVVNITARAEVAETPEPMMASASNGGTTGKASSSNALYSLRVSAGSGFIVDASGDIATNWHVVVGAYEMIVTFSDGSHAKAELVNASPLVDLALLHVNVGRKLQAVQWADSAKVQVGDPVLAIGNPLGVGMSVSGGIVSAVNRNIMDTPYDDFIQTDAAINHGNSGGPLFSMKGEVIGVNSAIISPTSGNAGLGFSMPANDARFIFDRLSKKVLRRPGYLGVKLQPLSPEMAQALGMEELQGSIVAAVSDDGPGARAGLHPGDVVVHYAGGTPTDERALLREIARTEPGSMVELGVRRAGKDITVQAKVEEWPTMWWEDVHGGTPGGPPHINVPADLGLTVAPLDDRMRASYAVRPEAQGVIVTGVLPGTDASQRGLGLGDVIEQVGDAAVNSPGDVQREIDRARAESRPFALFLVMRKNQPVTAAQLPGPKWYALRVSAS